MRVASTKASVAFQCGGPCDRLLRARTAHLERLFLPLRRGRNFVAHRLLMVSDLQLGVVNAVKFPQHPDKIGLTSQQASHRQTSSLSQRRKTKVFMLKTRWVSTNSS